MQDLPWQYLQRARQIWPRRVTAATAAMQTNEFCKESARYQRQLLLHEKHQRYLVQQSAFGGGSVYVLRWRWRCGGQWRRKLQEQADKKEHEYTLAHGKNADGCVQGLPHLWWHLWVCLVLLARSGLNEVYRKVLKVPKTNRRGEIWLPKMANGWLDAVAIQPFESGEYC